MERKCFVTRNEFLTAVGTVNADIKLPRTSAIYSTKYRLVAERIASLGRSIGATVQETITDDVVYVVGVKGFRV